MWMWVNAPAHLHHPCAALQINWRLSDEPVGPSTDPDHTDPEFRKNTRAMIFLGYTSNLISAGVREQIRCDVLDWSWPFPCWWAGRWVMFPSSHTSTPAGWEGDWQRDTTSTANALVLFSTAYLLATCILRYRFLAQHSMVDVLVTTAGGIEEDFIKCMGHTYVGDFQFKGALCACVAGWQPTRCLLAGIGTESCYISTRATKY